MARPLPRAVPSSPVLAAWLVAAALALAAGPARAEEGFRDFKVVVHPDNPAAEIDREALSRLFLKRTLRWPDGAAVQPVEPAAGRAREAFAAQVHRKSPAAVKSYWTQLIFSGRDVPPLEKATDEEVLAYVRTTRGAVGYVSPGAEAAGVKALPVRP
jgi:ABC-type phosphate transport system substrate-binding protein